MRVIICIVFLVISYSSVVAQKQAATSGFGNLTMNIETNRESFIPLEPIPITFNLSNQTSNNVLGHGSLDFSGNYIEIFVQNERRETKKFDQLAFERARLIVQEKDIPPQASTQKTQLLSFGLERYLLEIGNYKIKAVFYNKNRTQSVTSNWINIAITQPTDINLNAFKFLKKQPNISMFLHTIIDEKNTESLESFVAMFPGSNYTNYALFLLANHYIFKEEFTRAKEKLEILKKEKNFIFSAEVDKNLKELATK